ncbi:hypothetical protein PVAG01_04230 [Phlyctema vagabunda]|uniref:Uncharacterized protein n=1 Tax=Phlyctema vagabunda TaxID=108571 RepID=A0ABR4PNM3_9HELO
MQPNHSSGSRGIETIALSPSWPAEDLYAQSSLDFAPFGMNQVKAAPAFQQNMHNSSLGGGPRQFLTSRHLGYPLQNSVMHHVSHPQYTSTMQSMSPLFVRQLEDSALTAENGALVKAEHRFTGSQARLGTRGKAFSTSHVHLSSQKLDKVSHSQVRSQANFDGGKTGTVALDPHPDLEELSEDDDLTLEQLFRKKVLRNSNRQLPTRQIKSNKSEATEVENWLKLSSGAIGGLSTSVQKIKSVPMKERTALIKKSTISRRKPARKPNEALRDPKQKEYERQGRAAQRILVLESGVPVNSLFEERQNSTVEKKDGIEIALLKELNMLKEREREENHFREEMKLAAEAEEASRKAKELAELEKEEQRKRKRELTDMLDEKRKDKHRLDATNIISKQRQEAEAKRAQRESERKKEYTAQSDPLELKRLHQKQNLARLQAASLQASKGLNVGQEIQTIDLVSSDSSVNSRYDSDNDSDGLHSNHGPRKKQKRHCGSTGLIIREHQPSSALSIMRPSDFPPCQATLLAVRNSTEGSMRLIEKSLEDKSIENVYAERRARHGVRTGRKKPKRTEAKRSHNAQSVISNFTPESALGQFREIKAGHRAAQQAEAKRHRALLRGKSGHQDSPHNQEDCVPDNPMLNIAEESQDDRIHGKRQKKPRAKAIPKKRPASKAPRKNKAIVETVPELPKKYVRPVKKYYSIVEFFPKIDREKITIEAKKRAAQKKAAASRAKREKRDEEEKTKRREKSWAKARRDEEKRYRLEAQVAELEITEEGVQEHLDKFMKPRLENYRKRVEKEKARAAEEEARASQAELSAQDTDIYFRPLSEQISATTHQQTSSAPTCEPSPSSYSSNTNTQDSMDEDQRIAHQSLNDSLQALKAKHAAENAEFAQAASRKEIGPIDYDESEESEEDPYDDYDDVNHPVQPPVQSVDTVKQIESHISQESGAKTYADNELNPEDFESQLPEPVYHNSSDSTRSTGTSQDSSQTIVANQAIRVPAGDATSTSVKVYQVCQSSVIDDEQIPENIIHTFFDRQEATDLAADMINELRLRPVKPLSVTERFPDGLIQCSIELDDTRVTTIEVKGCFVPQSSIKKFDVAQLRPLHPRPSLYWVFEAKKRAMRLLDEETGTELISIESDIKIIASYSDRQLANKKCYDHLVQVLRPTSANMDENLAHNADVVPQLRAAHLEHDARGALLEMDLDTDVIPWINDFSHIRAWVEEHPIHGPIN